MFAAQDLDAWQQGLQFLMADPDGSPSKTQRSPAGNAAAAQPLAAKLKAQEELNERLQQENSMLREMIKRKDTTIAATWLQGGFQELVGNELANLT